MPKIQQLSPQVADMIAAGEVVERPASAAKELVENAIDAGAKNITVELHNGGMTFLRVTDDGCGIPADEAETAFLRHATSKLRQASDLEAIHTLGFRGEALAAICAVSRIDLLTKTPDAPFGVSLHLEAGKVTQKEEAGCPDGTTMIVRDLFFNTPARMKFMKRDSVEASALLAAVQRLALAHPEVSFRVIRDGAEQLYTSGDGQLLSAVYAVLGRQAAKEMVGVNSHYDKTALTGFVSRPTATRGTRANQLFFVNGRHIRSKTLTAALEEAYKNRLMVGRFPSCVLHLSVPEHLVDVNVHPAKTEVKFLNEREIFDCVRYGVQGALDQDTGRAELQLPEKQPARRAEPKQEFFRTMTAEDYKAFSQVLSEAPRVRPGAGAAELLKSPVRFAQESPVPAARQEQPKPVAQPPRAAAVPAVRESPAPQAPTAPSKPVQAPPSVPPEAQEQPALPLAQESWRIVGEAFDTYILVEQGEELLLIDKHAAHERILFEKLRARTEPVLPQLLLQPIVCTPEREEAAVLLENAALLSEFGYEFTDFGAGSLAIRQIPAELDPAEAASSLTALAGDLLEGRRPDPEGLRDAMLHTIACKAAIKGARHTDEKEKQALVREVLSRSDIRYCPHGRPVCIRLTRGQLERQFKRA